MLQPNYEQVRAGEGHVRVGRRQTQSGKHLFDGALDGLDGVLRIGLEAGDKVVQRAESLGIPRSDVIIDPLVLAVCADQQAGHTTLTATRLIATELGVNITMGASNVSHGLPDRHAINAAFLSMAIACGLTCPIANPLSTAVREAVLASYAALTLQSVMIDELDPAGVMNKQAARWWQANTGRIPLTSTPFLAPLRAGESAGEAAEAAEAVGVGSRT